MVVYSKTMEEQEEEFKEYTEPVDITVDGSTVTWNPGESQLTPKEGENADLIAENVSRFIYYSAPDRVTIPVTPEGPFLPATIENLYTVVWAIETLYYDAEISYSGDAPTMADMNLDEESNFDEDGNPLVR